ASEFHRASLGGSHREPEEPGSGQQAFHAGLTPRCPSELGTAPVYFRSKNGCGTNGRFGTSPAGRRNAMSSKSSDGTTIETTLGPPGNDGVNIIAGDRIIFRIGAV